MEAITVKFQGDVLKRVDKAISSHNFNSRTEFIREAVRDKLTELNREALVGEFLKFRGKARVKTSYKENRNVKGEVGKELMAELGKRFS